MNFFKNDKFAARNGIVLKECRPGYAVAQVEVNSDHYNGANIVHGGLYFTLADFAFAVAVNAYGVISLSINASITFVNRCDSGTITATAIEISRSNRLATYDINIADQSGQLLSNFKGQAYITKTVIEF